MLGLAVSHFSSWSSAIVQARSHISSRVPKSLITRYAGAFSMPPAICLNQAVHCGVKALQQMEIRIRLFKASQFRVLLVSNTPQKPLDVKARDKIGHR